MVWAQRSFRGEENQDRKGQVALFCFPGLLEKGKKVEKNKRLTGSNPLDLRTKWERLEEVLPQVQGKRSRSKSPNLSKFHPRGGRGLWFSVRVVVGGLGEGFSPYNLRAFLSVCIVIPPLK